MKTQRMILILSMILIAMSAFSGKPPAPVKKAFEQKFPGLSNVRWVKASAALWEVHFDVNGSDGFADFTVEGVWLETEIQTKESELPLAIENAIKTQCAGWIMVEVNKIETNQHGIVYVADVKKGMKNKAVAFKEDGTPLT